MFHFSIPTENEYPDADYGLLLSKELFGINLHILQNAEIKTRFHIYCLKNNLVCGMKASSVSTSLYLLAKTLLMHKTQYIISIPT